MYRKTVKLSMILNSFGSFPNNYLNNAVCYAEELFFLKCIWIKTQLSRNLTWIWLQRLHESKKQHTIIRTRIRLLDFNWSCHCRRLLLEKIYATKTSSSSLHLTNTQIIYLPPMSFKVRRNLYQNNLYAILPTLDQVPFDCICMILLDWTVQLYYIL